MIRIDHVALWSLDVDQRRGDGCPVVDGPRRTGDGYYGSIALDPDGNRVEISA